MIVAKPHPSLTEVSWTDELACILADCVAAISRLDARISASSLNDAWYARSRFSGLAGALRAQRIELEENDVFFAHFGLKSSRQVDMQDLDAVTESAPWLESFSRQPATGKRRNDRHWNENLPFIFDPPQKWDSAPQLIRALEVSAAWSRCQPTIECWLALPELLRRMNVTTNPLPCLAGGDPALRFAPRDADSTLRRSLKRLTKAAADGEGILNDLEGIANSLAKALKAELRPNSMRMLAVMLLEKVTVTPREIAAQLNISLSGAGKLLSKAQNRGFAYPQNGVCSWKAYLSADMAMRYGLIHRQRGRPSKGAPENADVSDLIARFDAAQHEIDAALLRPSRFFE